MAEQQIVLHYFMNDLLNHIRHYGPSRSIPPPFGPRAGATPALVSARYFSGNVVLD